MHTFTDPGGAAYDCYGGFVAAVGNNVLVGDSRKNNNGAAFLYDQSGNLLRTFTQPGGGAYDTFGCSAAAVGNNVLIGAQSSNNSSGTAYLFDQSGSLLTTFTDPGGAQMDHFGCSVAAVGNNVLIGAEGGLGSCLGSCGAAYLYDQSGGLLMTFTDPGGTAYDHFGDSVAAVGNNVLIGAYNSNNSRGTAYLFAVPEPSGLALLVVAGLAFATISARRRFRRR